MEYLLFAASREGLHTMEQTEDGMWRNPRLLSHPASLRALTGQGQLLVGGGRTGIYRSKNGGNDWQAVEPLPYPEQIRALELILSSAKSPLILAGTQPAGILRSEDRGISWQPSPEVAALRDDRGWNLPYAPEAGCVHGFTNRSGKLYAAVEQGGVLTAERAGSKWRLVPGSSGDPHTPPGPGDVHPDVHDLFSDPNYPERIYAATGGGLYRSPAENAPWEKIHPAYCRALWIDPDNSDHLVLGSAAGPDREGRIEQSRNAGVTWKTQEAGLEETPWRNKMVEKFLSSRGRLTALLSSGSLLTVSLKDWQWAPLKGWTGISRKFSCSPHDDRFTRSRTT